jgi:hypothetical protein
VIIPDQRIIIQESQILIPSREKILPSREILIPRFEIFLPQPSQLLFPTEPQILIYSGFNQLQVLTPKWVRNPAPQDPQQLMRKKLKSRGMRNKVITPSVFYMLPAPFSIAIPDWYGFMEYFPVVSRILSLSTLPALPVPPQYPMLPEPPARPLLSIREFPVTQIYYVLPSPYSICLTDLHTLTRLALPKAIELLALPPANEALHLMKAHHNIATSNYKQNRIAAPLYFAS